MNEPEFEREPRDVAQAHDPEAAQRALARVEQLLDKQHRVEALAQREQTPGEEKKALVGQLVDR
jgi:hypothetical protein